LSHTGSSSARWLCACPRRQRHGEPDGDLEQDAVEARASGGELARCGRVDPRHHDEWKRSGSTGDVAYAASGRR